MVTIEFELQKFPIDLNLLDLRASEQQLVQIGGETDDEFHSRGNTLLRTIFGLPKKRKPITGYVHGYRQLYRPLHIRISTEQLSIFSEWFNDLLTFKKECIITDTVTGIIYTLIGTFPVSYTSTGEIELSYDCCKITEPYAK